MNHSRANQPKRRTDRATTMLRRPKWRRLAIEQVENRLMLSGTNLDTSTFNIDSLATDYAIISAWDGNSHGDSFSDAIDFDLAPTVPITQTNPSGITDGVFHFRATDDFAANLSFDQLTPSQPTASLGTITYHLEPGVTSLFIKLVPAGSFSTLPAWESGYTGEGVLVAVVDSDFQSQHPDLYDNSLTNASHFHGTAAAGLVASGEVARMLEANPNLTFREVQEQLLARPSDAQSLVAAAENNEFGGTGLAYSVTNADSVFVREISGPWIENSPDAAGPDVHYHYQLAGTDGVPPPEILLNSSAAADDTLVVSTADVPAEGGMIPIQQIVGELAGETIAATTTGEPMAPVDDAAEITGELARVAVMELIQGEADPAAPQPTADHTYLVTANDAAITPASTEARRDSGRTASQSAIKAFAEQAGLATSMIAPVNPVYLAAMAQAANDAFAAVVGADLTGRLGDAALESVPPANAARSEAFSQWGDDERNEPRAEAVDQSNRWLDATPILLVLACERVVAAKKKRQQRDPVRQSARATLLPADAC